MFGARRRLRRLPARGYFFAVRPIAALFVLACAVLGAGCHRIMPEPPQVTVAEMEPSGRAAKEPNCKMPVLHAEPLEDFRKVALIDAVGEPGTDENELLPLIIRKACETGADAVMITESKAQHSERAVGMVAGGRTGYFVSAMAINYVNSGTGAAGRHDDAAP